MKWDNSAILTMVDSLASEKLAIDRAIDRAPVVENPTTSGAKSDESYSWRKAESIHDYLATKPRLAARYREIGILALLEM